MLRFSQAAAAAAALRAASTYVAAACPPALATMAVRPPPYEARLTGNACEPPLARGAVELLSSLLRPNAAALEWGAGASSLWLLSGRVSRLISIEHDARRSGRVREALEAALGAAYVDERWELHVVPPAAPVLTFLQASWCRRIVSQGWCTVQARHVGGGARCRCLVPQPAHSAAATRKYLPAYQPPPVVLGTGGVVRALLQAVRRCLAARRPGREL